MLERVYLIKLAVDPSPKTMLGSTKCHATSKNLSIGFVENNRGFFNPNSGNH
jgi:hypothetical protein